MCTSIVRVDQHYIETLMISHRARDYVTRRPIPSCSPGSFYQGQEFLITLKQASVQRESIRCLTCRLGACSLWRARLGLDDGPDSVGCDDQVIALDVLAIGEDYSAGLNIYIGYLGTEADLDAAKPFGPC